MLRSRLTECIVIARGLQDLVARISRDRLGATIPSSKRLAMEALKVESEVRAQESDALPVPVCSYAITSESLKRRPKLEGMPQKLSADADEAEIVHDLFIAIGSKNIDGNTLCEKLKLFTKEHMEQGGESQKTLASALEKLIQERTKEDPDITLEIFRTVVMDLPRVRAERVHFAQALMVHEWLASLIPKGTFFDGLYGLRRLSEKSDEEVTDFAHKTALFLSGEVEPLLFQAITKLRGVDANVTNALEQNSKFGLDQTAIKGSFAELSDFYDGPEKMIGNPNPKATEGIRREHCERKNADRPHTTPNYKLTTTPRKEFHFVARSTGFACEYPQIPKEEERRSPSDSGRDFVALETFTEHPRAKKAGMREAEVIALRLYTGPMYIWYNAVLRGNDFPAGMRASLEGNRYETTIFCIISGIIKLSKLTEVPEDRRVYRGLGGVLLPDEFWSKKEGFRGGVERGLMSATADRAVAMQYSGKDGRRCTIFEILVGRIDIGADLGWVSQYPNEREVLFPPLSCLEVMGEPHVEDGVIVIPTRVNMCLRGLTLEQLVERRKELHMAMVKNLREELSIEAPAAIGGSEAGDAAGAQAVVQSVQQAFEVLEETYRRTPAEEFNDDANYKDFTTEAIGSKSLALNKVRIYSDLRSRRAAPALLDAVVGRPLKDFESRAVVLELQTGMVGFPWGDVVDKSVVRFGRWRPDGTPPECLRRVAEELRSNANFRTATLLAADGRELILSLPHEGIATRSIDWAGQAAVREAPVLAALLLRLCGEVETVDLR